jgi:hypothetical protein
MEGAPSTHCIGGWLGRKVGMDLTLTLPGIEPWPSSTSLYRLSYPDSWNSTLGTLKLAFLWLRMQVSELGQVEFC